MIEFHADDYGLFAGQSRRILNCHTNGVLNGISIFANGDALQECLDLVRPAVDGISVSVHLNFLQGKSLCSREKTGLLTDEKGIFSISFAHLLAVSFLPARSRYKKHLKNEIRAQIFALLPFLKETGKRLRIDGHAHWHMIPVVFDALMEVVEEEALDVAYIRIPDEPLSVIAKNLLRILPFHPINIVKTLLLKLMASRNCRKYHSRLSAMDQSVFTGVLLSGCFSREKAEALLPDLLDYAAKKHCNIELLAHPGAVLEAEDLKKVTNPQDVHFFTEQGRIEEAEMFKSITLP